MKKGISLIALVITIVVLIILTGVVIVNSINENLLNNTEYSVEEYNKKVMVENIKNDIENKRMEKVKQGIYTLDYASDILNIINNYGTLDSNTLKVTINEPRLEMWLYEIVKIPLEEYSQITYENNILTVQTELTNNEYVVEYTVDAGANWNRYTKAVTINEESGIYVRLINKEGTVVSNTIKVTIGAIKVIDNIGPTVSITADTTDITNVRSITYTIIFNEPVVGFRAEDITVENGTKGTFTKINDIEYTIVVTNNTDCIQKVIVAEGVCTDVSGNLNSQGSKEININRTVPVVTISPNGSSAVKYINVIITASGANELKTDNEYKYCFTTNKTIQGNEEWKIYTSGASFTIGTGLNGTYYIHTKKIYDVIGNESEAVTSNPFVFDNTAPSLGTITGSGTTSNITLKSTVTDTTGVTGYAITTSTAIPSSWNAVDLTTSWSANVATTNTGTVYLHVKDSAGNTNYGSVNVCTGQTNSCNSAWSCPGGSKTFVKQICTCGREWYSEFPLATHKECYRCGGHIDKTINQNYYCNDCNAFWGHQDSTGKTTWDPDVKIVEYTRVYNETLCQHKSLYKHTVACGHGIYSSHQYCSHNSNQVYHTY